MSEPTREPVEYLLAVERPATKDEGQRFEYIRFYSSLTYAQVQERVKALVDELHSWTPRSPAQWQP